MHEFVIDATFVVLCVGCVHKGLAAVIDAVCIHALRMVPARVRYTYLASQAIRDIDAFPFLPVAKGRLRVHGGQMNREVRVVNLTGEGLIESARNVVAPVQMEDIACNECRLEEREALNVIPVHVAEEHVSDEGHLLQELLAEQTQPGAAIEDKDGLARAKLDAARVAPGLDRVRPWGGDAAANSPEGDLHQS